MQFEAAEREGMVRVFDAAPLTVMSLVVVFLVIFLFEPQMAGCH